MSASNRFLTKGERSSLNDRQRAVHSESYGSVNVNNNNNVERSSAVESRDSVLTAATSTTKSLTNSAADMESLVGEGLLPTDTEDDFAAYNPKNGRSDFRNERKDFGNSDGHTPLNRSTSALCSGPALWLASLLVIVLIASSCVMVYFLFPSTLRARGNRWPPPSSTSDNGMVSPSDVSFKLMYPRVDRGKDYDDPIDNFLTPSLFHPSLLYQGEDPNRIFVFPFPTGAFWTNLALPPTADQGLSYPIFVYPYGYKWSDSLLDVSYPYAHRKEEPQAIHDYFFPDLRFSCNETVVSRHITSFDPLSVSLQYETEGKGLWSAFLVQGSPYVTMEFGGVTPIIRALSTFESLDCPPTRNPPEGGRQRRLSYGVCWSDTDSSGRIKLARGVQFILRTAEGYSWIIFTSVPVGLEFDTKLRTTIRATEPYNGAFRAAIIPTQGVAFEDLSKSSGLQRLVNHAGIYPISGEVSWLFGTSETVAPSSSYSSSFIKTLSQVVSSGSGGTQSKRVGSISFKFKTRNFSPASGANTAKPLLMLALPHHSRRLPSFVLLGPEGFDLTYSTIKGPMTAVIGTSWTYDQQLVSPGFDNDVGSTTKKLFLDPFVRKALVDNLKQDINIALPTKTEDIYGFGKQSARLAQLAHVASRLIGKDGPTNRSSSNATIAEGDDAILLLKDAADRLSSSLEALLTSKVSDFLVYDANLGGLVTHDGLLDSSADFGNGRYNDHHFHYGYVLYACAVMGSLDPSFVTRFRAQVDAIYFDVAHDSNFDSRRRADGIFFPGARHMNWFDGHSYASGLFPFGNGKSQESSSEAVNCYYGAYLWSIVRNGAGDDPESDKSSETDFARLLLSLEINGAQTYWHMSPSDVNQTVHTNPTILPRPKIYSNSFASNYMVGNIGMNDAICTTWFGTQPLYVHMINFLPITSAAGELFPRDYAAAEYQAALASLSEVEMAWRGFVVAHHAIYDPNAAWIEAQGLFSPTLDSGLSKTQILYWISTRKGFVVPIQSDVTGNSTNGSDSCDENKVCAASGLEGKCCPTANGVMLDCCF